MTSRKTATFLAGWIAVAVATGCGRAGEPEPRADSKAGVREVTHGIDVTGMDQSVVPGDDFFGYANGGWLKATEIPPDRSRYGIGAVLTELTQQQTRDILADAAAGKSASGSGERKLGDYFASYLDEQAIASSGTAPLAGTLKSIEAIADRRGLSAWLGQSIRADVDPLNNTNFQTDHVFGVWVSQDLDDPAHYAPYLLQGGLGMPDRNYYIEASPRMEKMRQTSLPNGNIATVPPLCHHR